MKKYKIALLFLMMNTLLFSQVSKYEEVSILGEKVYFPKKTSEYLIELLESQDKEAYYEITKVYISLHEFTAAEKYLKQYESESDNYIKISELYHLIGNYNKEIEYLEKYLENPLDDLDKLKYYDYIANLITDKKLEIPSDKYNLSNLDRLRVYINQPEEYYNYFISQQWDDNQKKLIVSDIIQTGTKSEYFQNILDSIASEKQLEKIYFANIESISDSAGYYKYFALIEKNTKINGFRNEFEKLQYLRYKNDLTADFYKDKMAYDFAVKKDTSNLIKLYSIEPDFKLMYNLALENDKAFYDFILNQKSKGVEGENIVKLVKLFNEKFPVSTYSGKVLKLEFEYMQNEEQKLELINNYLEKHTEVKGNLEFIITKLNILVNLDQKKEAENLLKNIIFSSYEYRELVEFYSKLLEQDGRVEELITNLLKLNDKSFYIEKSVEYSFKIDETYEDILISYYFEKGDYQNLLEYKDNLSYEMYDKLLKSGWQEFLGAAIAKYSLQEQWVDKSKFKYFFFDKTYEYSDDEKVAEIFEKDKRTDAEIYYLAKYYEVVGDFEKSNELLEGLEKEYLLTEL